jgi:hypothetical protein
LEDDWLTEVLDKLCEGKLVKDWELHEGLLLFRGKIFVPRDKVVRNLVLESRHDTGSRSPRISLYLRTNFKNVLLAFYEKSG